jgi:hypothetical protein
MNKKVLQYYSFFLLFPIIIVGYIITAIGIMLKVFGYALRFDFDSAIDEIEFTDFNWVKKHG